MLLLSIRVVIGAAIVVGCLNCEFASSRWHIAKQRKLIKAMAGDWKKIRAGLRDPQGKDSRSGRASLSSAIMSKLIADDVNLVVQPFHLLEKSR